MLFRSRVFIVRRSVSGGTIKFSPTNHGLDVPKVVVATFVRPVSSVDPRPTFVISRDEHLILDVVLGDQTLFVCDDEVELAWRLYDPVIENKGINVFPYEPGTWGPAEMNRLGAPWHNPMVSEEVISNEWIRI